MRADISYHVALLALLSFACSAEPSAPDAESTDRGGFGDAGTHLDADLPTPDLGTPADAASSTDSGIRSDAEVALDAAAGADAQTALDAGTSDAGVGPVQAVLDRRCRYDERIGLVVVSNEGGGTRYLGLSLFDRPLPWLGPPELSDAACEFHRASQVQCACSSDQVCSYQGVCVDPPMSVSEAEIVVSGLSGTQTMSGGGSITLDDDVLSLQLTAGPLDIEVSGMSIPDALINPSGVLTGDYDVPLAIDLSWQAPANSGQVHSHTDINHHVFEPTFTTCVVPAVAESLHIDGAMLQPLAVATGLEFQAIQHVRFAAAETAAGCVEFRFSRSEFVSIF
jgi:hypothetical protein